MLKPIRTAICVSVVLGMMPAAVQASSLFSDDVQTVLRTETFTAEGQAGYIQANSSEYVYRVPGNGSKLSQLDWTASAAALGGRLAWRPLDWLVLRGRGWATVAADGSMRDYDWLAGYYGQDSWSHRSISPNTGLQAWQADVSAAATYWQTEDLALTAIGGFRHYEASWRASGGTYLYSTSAFRDTPGTLPPGIGITYRQTWDTPYVGLGLSLSAADWTVTGEVVGSPFVMASDQDHHVLRSLSYRENFSRSGMVGASLGAEYRLSDLLSLTGRIEYQRYFQARGDTKVTDDISGFMQTAPKPSSGADAETFFASVGVKARL